MKKMLKAALCIPLSLLLLFSSDMLAQTSPQASNFPWNSYIPQRIPNSFSSIIGQSGTTLLPGTNGQNYPYEWYLPLPFAFTFLDQLYPSGFNMTVSMSGYVGFNSPVVLQGNYFYYTYYNSDNYLSVYSRCIWVYSSDLTTSGTTDAGIYYRVDGLAGNRVLTIEWRVTGISYPPGNPGNFQLKLYEAPNGRMDMLYGPNSIDRTEPALNVFGYGACVGIKKFGQAQGQPTGNDAEKLMIFLPPDKNPDTVAITRLPTINYFGSNPFYPVNYAYYQSYSGPVPVYYASSPVYHYKFPEVNGVRIGYRMTPVIDDVAADSVWFTPGRSANVYPAQSLVTINGRFRNVGKNPRQFVPVRADVYRDQDPTLITSFSGIAFTTYSVQGMTSDVVFGAVGSPITDNTGVYTVKIYPQFAQDQDAGDDTLRTTFFIAKPNDVTTWSILQPYSNVAPLNYQYPIGIGVPIEARFLNIGFNTQVDVPIGYIITDQFGTVVAKDETNIVPGTWAPATYRDINLPPWVPVTPGRYYLKVYTLLGTDEQRSNDTMPNYKSQGLPFDVNYEIEVEALPPGFTPHSPVLGLSYPDGKPIKVQAGFRNNGISDATNVPANVVIRDANNNIVYNRNATILNLTAERRSVRSSRTLFRMDLDSTA